MENAGVGTTMQRHCVDIAVRLPDELELFPVPAGQDPGVVLQAGVTWVITVERSGLSAETLGQSLLLRHTSNAR